MNRLASMLRTRGVWPAVEAELIRLGVAYQLVQGGKHPVVQVTVGDQLRRIPIAGSPRSRGQTIRKSVAQVRRVVSRLREVAYG